jgi:hypothetical protein
MRQAAEELRQWVTQSELAPQRERHGPAAERRPRARAESGPSRSGRRGGESEAVPQYVMVDRAGKVLGRVGAVQNAIYFPAISPDGKSIAVSARDGEVNDRDLWIHDVASGLKRVHSPAKGNECFRVRSIGPRRGAFHRTADTSHLFRTRRARSRFMSPVSRIRQPKAAVGRQIRVAARSSSCSFL